MDRQPDPDIAEAIAGALDWWRDAGVDSDFSDEPTRWIAEPEQQPQAPPEGPRSKAEPERKPRPKAPSEPSPPATPAFDRAALPEDLAGFTRWWLEERALAEGPVASRVSPRGPAGADLMVIVPEPERDDRETLLSGPQGRLLDAMLAAMGYAEDAVYRASALPRHMPGADWDAIAARGMGAVLARHIKLVRPKRLAIFGANVLPLAGNDPPQAPADLQFFNHEGPSIPLLACRSLAALLEQPRWKARIWQAWLEWTV